MGKQSDAQQLCNLSISFLRPPFNFHISRVWCVDKFFRGKTFNLLPIFLVKVINCRASMDEALLPTTYFNGSRKRRTIPLFFWSPLQLMTVTQSQKSRNFLIFSMEIIWQRKKAEWVGADFSIVFANAIGKSLFFHSLDELYNGN